MTPTNQQEIDDSLAALLEAERKAQFRQQWRMPVLPAQYAAAHAIEDEAMDDIHDCESDA